MRYNSLVATADSVMAYKYVVRNIARQHGKVVTFMPKPLFDDNGTRLGFLRCVKPPWAKLLAVDVSTGEIVWEVPLGIEERLPEDKQNVGSHGVGGPMVTASGLTFIGAATDPYLRAFSTETGEELWRGEVPTGAQATPLTYRVHPDSRQLVVIAAGGHGLLGVPTNDAVVAFALP